jgi:hypothetical protein
MARCSWSEGGNIEGGAGTVVTAASLAPVRNGAGTGDIAGSASDSPNSTLTEVAAATVVMVLVRLASFPINSRGSYSTTSPRLWPRDFASSRRTYKCWRVSEMPGWAC